MSEEKKKFSDPEGKFSIIISPKWEYRAVDETSRKGLHQFEVSPGCVFQISCNILNDHISEIVSQKKIIPHDFSLPNISFVENHQNRSNFESYDWMALIDNHFYLALYYFDPKLKNPKDIAVDLMEIRMALRHITIHTKNVVQKEPNECEVQPGGHNYLDIVCWRKLPDKFFKSVTRQKAFNTIKISPLKADPLRLYALLISKISHQPNGFFDLVKVNKPLDNTIWWDFVLECDKGFIQVWRTPYVLEANFFFEGELDLELFFKSNIEKYKDEIDKAIENFERHTIYINHYQSYHQCVETLWKDISEIDLTLPQSIQGHTVLMKEFENYAEELKKFTERSVKYHALAKSLVLNAAFKIESFLNLIIRIGCTPELRNYPDVLSKFTKQDFQFRIKNLRFYTQIFSGDIDMSGDIYRQTRELMTLRNKYVHYEEDTSHNKLGKIYYDRDYPLHPLGDHRPAVEAMIQTYHHPSLDTVRNAYETSNNFVSMLQSLIIEKLRESIQHLIEQNPIGFNETRKVYSSVYMPASLDFFTSVEK